MPAAFVSVNIVSAKTNTRNSRRSAVPRAPRPRSLSLPLHLGTVRSYLFPLHLRATPPVYTLPAPRPGTRASARHQGASASSHPRIRARLTGTSYRSAAHFRFAKNIDRPSESLVPCWTRKTRSARAWVAFSTALPVLLRRGFATIGKIGNLFNSFDFLN